MGSIQAIIIGWAKSWQIIPTTEAEDKLSNLRLQLCVRCPFSATSKLLELINGQGEYVDVIKCTKCGCPSKQKTLVVTEECPVKRW